MNRHALALFPALHGTDVAFDVAGNFLPGVKEDLRGLARGFLRRDCREILHIQLLVPILDRAGEALNRNTRTITRQLPRITPQTYLYGLLQLALAAGPRDSHTQAKLGGYL
jgi:hypothetical protein